MENEQLCTTALARVPTLPQASTVLFPGTVLPLHVTDAETLSLLADVLSTDRLIVVVKLASVVSPSHGGPRLCEVGCIGSVIHAEKQPNGPYNILIQGLQRVRLIQEIVDDAVYRCFRVELIPTPTESELVGASRELGRMESCIMSLRSSLEDRDDQLCEVLRSTADPVQLADVLAAAVISDSDLQQRLLATTSIEQRISALIDGLADVMVRNGAPPKQAQMN